MVDAPAKEMVANRPVRGSNNSFTPQIYRSARLYQEQSRDGSPAIIPRDPQRAAVGLRQKVCPVVMPFTFGHRCIFGISLNSSSLKYF